MTKNNFITFFKVIASIALGIIAAASGILVVLSILVAIFDAEDIWSIIAVGIITIFLIAVFIGCVVLMGLIWRNVKETIKKAMKIFLIAMACVAAIVIMAFLYGAFVPETTGAAGLAVVINVASLVALGICKKQDNKKGMVITIGILIANVIISLLGQNNVPEFIRAIKGPDFIGIWFKTFFLVALSAFLIGSIVAVYLYKKDFDEAKKLIYTDGDLMILRGFDRFRLMGYYVLKAKLHGIIKITIKQFDDEEESAMQVVELNKDIPKEELKEYLEQNPQVAKIVNHISEDVRVVDVVRNVLPTPVISGDGGCYAESLIRKASSVLKYSCLAALLIPGVLLLLKLYMGLTNGKTVENLVIILLLFMPIATGLLLRFKSWLSEVMKQMFFVNPLFSFKSLKYENIEEFFDNADIEKENMSEQEIKDILRAYVLYNYVPSEFSNGEAYLKPTFANEVFSSVASAQALYLATQKSASGSSCSSCSSCSGCGGCDGCGGCGGCGD